MTPKERFEKERKRNIQKMGRELALQKKSLDWTITTAPHKYVYNFDWLGRPIIQFPQDMVAVQELIWQVKPDLIIETGIAHGGSLILSASILALIDWPRKTRRRVLGIDIEIRPHNRAALKAHPLKSIIEMIEGSSTDPQIIQKIQKRSRDFRRIMVLLDSHHTHEHVSQELEAYAPLVTKGSYVIVSDTAIEDVPAKISANRTWGKGNNPQTAVREFLKTHKNFKVNLEIQNKLLISSSPGGYLERLR